MTRARGIVRGTDKVGDWRTKYMLTTPPQLVPAGGGIRLSITPSVTRFIVSLANFTSAHSCIQEWRYTVVSATGTIIAQFTGQFDINGSIPFPEVGAFVVEPTQTIIFDVINNDDVARTMNLSIAGVYEKI